MQNTALMSLEKTAGGRFSKVLFWLETEKDMNQTQLGEFLGHTQGWVSKLANYEKSRFTRATRIKLERLRELGVNPDYLDDPDAPMLLKDVPETQGMNRDELERQIWDLKRQIIKLEGELLEKKKENFELKKLIE